MGIRNRDGALYAATGIDNAGLYEGRREAKGIIKAMAGQITSFDVFSGIGISAATAFASAAKSSYDFEKEFRKNMLEVATKYLLRQPWLLRIFVINLPWHICRG
ncbi:MAG: hypothetical protein RR382_01665 [Tannerellaceae bacterium]